MVRVNPLHTATADYCSSENEINQAIEAGADIIILPMFRTADDVKKFVSYVDGRAKVQLLVETAEATANIDSILEVPGIDEVHIGLNDLHLAMHKTFMFELICDDTVSNLCNKIKEKGIKYGFGGIARVGYGMLPAEHIIAEHYHLSSTAAILSRGFCDANIVKDPREIESIFIEGVKNIRLKEKEVEKYSEEEYKEFEENHQYGIIKPLNLCGGEGIRKFESSKIGGYKYCKKNKCLIEEEFIQHDIN